MTTRRRQAGSLLVLIGFLLLHAFAEAACFDLVKVDGRNAWTLAQADQPVEIEVVIPFYNTLVPLEQQLSALLADAPFRRKVVLTQGTVLKDPRYFLPAMTEAERAAISAMKSPDPKRPFPSWRLLGRYALLRPVKGALPTILSQGNRSFAFSPTSVPVQSGDVFVLMELEGCL
jgi:hypothetical protein